MSFSGQWKNTYGSVMSLTQALDGTIAGSYSSTTGSKGEYYVLGYANPADATPTLGQAAALSIYWKPYAGAGAPDESWHWVSGLSGQLTLSTSPASLLLLHTMVATCDFPELPATAGTYLDKLVYTPNTPVTTAALQAPQIMQPPAAAADPVSGTWVCSNPPVTLTLQVVMGRYGQLGGVIDIPGHLESKIQGFTDLDAVSGGLNLQGVAVSAFDSTTGQCISLAGSVNLTTGLLTLTDLTSSRTSTINPDNTYLQTTTATWIFTRSA